MLILINNSHSPTDQQSLSISPSPAFSLFWTFIFIRNITPYYYNIDGKTGQGCTR
jgi:hypothetical protein